MNEQRTPQGWRRHLGGACLLALALSACGGGDGGSAAPPPGGIACGPIPASPASVDPTAAGLIASSALNISINAVCIEGPPVVSFTVTNQDGVAMAGLTAADVRFSIAKIIPFSNGDPGNWQNYINRVRNGAVQGSQERTEPGYVFGTFVSNGEGTYLYEFATDIADPAANACPAPCTDAEGNPLDISYQPSLTHRVAIQQANAAYPRASGIRDVVPSGAPGSSRDIVLSSTCDTCHLQLTAHGTGVDTGFCVTCHNPGSWVAQAPDETVDFKVMIHKIHYNVFNSVNDDDPAAPNYLPPELPSVDAGFPYTIGATDFSTPVFTQDARNCERCHDGRLSAQGDNWRTQPSIGACGSCHDNVYFSALPDLSRPYQTIPHTGGAQADNSACTLCHGPGEVSDVAVAHDFPARLKAGAAKFRFNIVSATSTSPGSSPVVTFSVTDPTDGDAPYDITTDPAFTSGASSLNVRLAWTDESRADIGNDGNGGDFGQPVGISALTSAVPGGSAGTYTVTSPVAIPPGQSGTLRVVMDGHPAGDVTTPGTFEDRLAVKSVFRDFPITGAAAARRVVVDIAKCNVCHDVLSLHGNNRTDEPQVCVVCHNPNATDKRRRTTPPFADGKVEEAVDFKTMVHAVHAGQASNGGYRENGLVIYGFNGSVNDFSNVVFPGSLSRCTTCHTSTSYQLAGIWDSPTANGILGTTTSTGASTSDAADNLRTTPTAAVCTSCHDSRFAQTHVTGIGGGQASVTQATIDASAPEGCPSCHGPGGPVDVEKVHGVN